MNLMQSLTNIPDWIDDGLIIAANKLRCTRAADRAKMFEHLGRLAAHYGATIDTESPGWSEATRCRVVFLRLNDAYVMVILDGDSTLSRGGRDDYLGHWNIKITSSARYSARFESMVGRVNPYHRQKATLGVTGFGCFILRLAIALSAIKDGIAFE